MKRNWAHGAAGEKKKCGARKQRTDEEAQVKEETQSTRSVFQETKDRFTWIIRRRRRMRIRKRRGRTVKSLQVAGEGKKPLQWRLMHVNSLLGEKIKRKNSAASAK